MKKKKITFEVFYYYIQRKPDGTCVFDRYDIMYNSFRLQYTYLTNAIKRAYKTLSADGYEFGIGVRIAEQTHIVYCTPRYQMLPGHVHNTNTAMDLSTHKKYTGKEIK